ncbi:MAG: hypothetical protein LBB43_05105 [Spirochaetaceae bacterium]|jgi:hypothetical protein|nr:hypothetical protein [Spirochaetaceae bacterium]
MLPLIALILAVAGGLIAITIALLSWDKIIGWFRARQNLKQKDKDNIAFTLQQKLKDGKYETVQGIFNDSSGELLDGEKTIAKDIDEKVAKVHSKEELVVYN